MTREEAIAILEVSKHMATSGRMYNQAIDMAIEALSTPSGDIISRADAIDSVWKLDKEATEYVIDDTHEIHGYCTAIGVCVGELSALPSADAKSVRSKCEVEIKKVELKDGFKIDDVPQDWKPKVIGNVEVVVRCKDCRFWKNEHLCLVMSRYGSMDTKAEHYCSYGERREE